MSRDETESELEYFRKRDSSDNATTTPPSDEAIRLPAIWGIEAFTPSLIGNLRAGAEKLGWTASDHHLSPDFTEWVADLRSQSGGGGWMNLGHIVAPGTSRALMRSREAPLPEGVKHIQAHIFQPFPSTTILTCLFSLDDALARSYQQPLQETYRSYKRPIDGGGHAIISVEQQKKAAVEFVRASLYSVVTEWFAEYFPGHFCMDINGRSIPTCELLLFTQQKEFHQGRSLGEPNFLEMLDLGQSFYAWQCQQLSGLFLSLNEEKTRSGRAVLYGNSELALGDKDLKAYGRDKESRLTNWLHEFDSTLATRAVALMAKNFVRQLGATRDAFGALPAGGGVEGLGQLRKLDLAILDFQRDAVPFSRDLSGYCEYEKRFLSEVFEFEPVTQPPSWERRLFADTRKHLQALARHMQGSEEHLRFLAGQIGQAINAISNQELAESNLRLQRQIGVMTYIMLVLAAVAAIEPLKVLADWITQLLEST